MENRSANLPNIGSDGIMITLYIKLAREIMVARLSEGILSFKYLLMMGQKAPLKNEMAKIKEIATKLWRNPMKRFEKTNITGILIRNPLSPVIDSKREANEAPAAASNVANR
ncbi:MAG: hypothetical protein HXS48_00930 [Theionarchaea archaeon]|nr:hypothetical protein [Theionarchaea archaeon]